MLQPLQLKDVSARHAKEIAELRDFFEKADCVLETAESLPAIAHRLQRDRAFHRDLTSHLWVVMDVCKGNISYADLLGVLAIAAAGSHFAAEAEEVDAHALLRFVMEARHSLYGPDVSAGPGISAGPAGTGEQRNLLVPSAAAPPQPIQRSVVREQVSRPQARTVPLEFESLDEEETGGSNDSNDSRRRYLWIAACVLAALCIGLVLHDRTTRTARVTPEGTSDKASSQPAAAPVPAAAASEESTLPSSEVASVAAAPSSTVNGRTSHKPASTKPVSSRPATPSAPAVALRDNAAALRGTAATTPAIPPAPTAASAPPSVPAPVVSRTAPAAAPAARNAPAVSTTPAAPRLGVAGANAAADFSNAVGERHAPRLLHRTPEEQQELAVASRPASIAPAPAPNAPHGTVLANSVGVHAANVIYSPIPDYPPAAASAHVQGEVKLETDVNREGNVVAVRVISGPPLLRAAALDAAQRWRYRPDKVNGQSIAISAVTVFEFHLP